MTRFKQSLIACGLAALAFPSAALAQAEAKKFGDWSFVKTATTCLAVFSQNDQTIFMLASRKSSSVSVSSSFSRRETEMSTHRINMIFGTKATARESDITAAKVIGPTISYFLPLKAEVVAQLFQLDPRFHGERGGVRVWAFEMPKADTDAAMAALIDCFAKLPPA